MWQRAVSAVGGGGGKIPFTLTVYSNRATISKQNCYLWLDNDTIKVHVEANGTLNYSGSANATVFSPLPRMNNSGTQIALDTIWKLSNYNTTLECFDIRSIGSITSGQSFSINVDYAF